MPNKEVSELLERKLNDGREFRDMEIRALADETDAQMIVEGYATTFNQPYELWREPGYTVMEQIDARALDEADVSDVIMQYNHEGRVFARNTNGTLMLKPDDVGYFTRAILGGTDIGRQLYQEIKGGYTNKMSWAFRVEKDRRDIEENAETGEVKILRTILKVSKVYDVSAVSLPANPATTISARSYGEGVIAEAKAERQRAEEERIAKEKARARIRIAAGK